MKSRILKLIMVSVLVVFWAGEAGAVHNLFKEMDTNHDSKVDREEFAKDMEMTAFDKLDADKDGFITREEWRKMDYIEDLGKSHEVFKYADRNADKRISFPEFSEYAKKYSNIEEAFMTLDKDKDDSLSFDEVTLRPLFRLFIIRY